MSALRAKRLAFCILIPLLAGCETLGYYGHLAGGQIDLLWSRVPVERVLDGLEEEGVVSDGASGVPGEEADRAALKRHLLLSRELLEFAETELKLDPGGRYRSYVDLDRDAVVWNVFAAPPLSLEPEEWCHPFVGCAPYRGYFDRARAERFKARLEGEGLETYLGAVSAYSTLGWFDDPLLSTFVDMEEADFAELLFHELAHSRIWAKDDATFNESFAAFVGRRGLQSWLEADGREAAFREHLEQQQGWIAARDLLLRTRRSLEEIYGSGGESGALLQRKRVLLDGVAVCLEREAERTGVDGYRRLIERLNNAYLASLATYSDDREAFRILFEQADGWESFYASVESLVAMDGASRRAELDRLVSRFSAQEQITSGGDDHGAQEIQCEALAGHGLDGELSGAEHDHVGGGRHG
jgi:predicted aminopeptidase